MSIVGTKYRAILEKIDRAQPEKLFLVIASIFCGIFVFAIPPLQGWDETTHFLRAYQVSEVNFIPDRFNGDQAGGLLPVNVINMSDQLLGDLVRASQSGNKRPADVRIISKYAQENDIDKRTAQKQFEASAVYTPVAYAPAALGIATARTAHLPLVSFVYVARIFTLITYMTLIYWAIKLIPVGKWVLFVVALFPQPATLAVSLGPDALIIGSTALLIALFVKVLYQKDIITNKQLLIFLGLSVALGLMKPPYVLLSILAVCIPLVKFGSKKRYFAWAGGIVLATFLISAAWNLSVSDIAKNIHTYQRPEVNVNPDEQVHFILHEPIKYLAILTNQMTLNTNPVYQQAVQHVTWKGIHIPLWTVSIAYFMLILAFITTRSKDVKTTQPGWLSRYGPILIALAIMALVYTTLYVSFSIVGSSHIEGVNGRYFTPIIFLLIPAVAFIKTSKPLITLNLEKVKRLFVFSSVFLLVFTLCVIVSANYVPDI